ncbi:MAG: DUF447 domain-containing protein [Planctomycetota bacterium]
MNDAEITPPRHESDAPQLGVDGRVLEGMVSTRDADGTVRLSPMGPIVDQQIHRLVMRPFRGSTTYANLTRSRQGVFHVVDDVLLIAQSAIGAPDPTPPTHVGSSIGFDILDDACRWFAFVLEEVDDSQQRAVMYGRIVAHGEQRPFFGFNRAMHAVLEAAILATRVDFIDANQLSTELRRLAPIVQKTGAAVEHRAFELLVDYVDRRLAMDAVDHVRKGVS